MNAVTQPPPPVNEPIRSYAPGSRERATLEARIKEMAAEPVEFTMTVDGRQSLGGGDEISVTQPQRHAHVLGTMRNATNDDVAAAVAAAKRAAPAWGATSYDERAGIVLKAAELAAGPWRDSLNAATILGQGKSVIQAEIDAACELVDFFRYNVAFGRQILADQPRSTADVWNRMDYRALEGFVLAITPFNFTAIAANLPVAPALMGNVVVWKPSPTQQLAAHVTMRMLEEAGLPPGVINLVTGDGRAVSEVALTDPDLAGLHFTGSTATFQHLWRTVGENIAGYRGYPRLVGETGGKDFVIAHPSADVAALRTALIRGAFEYQGQKCSAASRAYVPESVWRRLEDDLLAETASLPQGDVTDFGNFLGAVIDERSFNRLGGVQDAAAADPELTTLIGNTRDGSEGWFVHPTIWRTSNPAHSSMSTEYFGPLLSVFVFPDADFDAVVDQAADIAPYALTGAIFSQDRLALDAVMQRLRYSAGNLYTNDKPTGAVVGMQPFGGARASGTNDKSGSYLNLVRWVSPRTLKETFVPPTDWRYPHLGS